MGREVVVHTATWGERSRISQLLRGVPAKISKAELRPAAGISVRRLASAPISFSCSLLCERSLEDGVISFFFTVVGVMFVGPV